MKLKNLAGTQETGRGARTLGERWEFPGSYAPPTVVRKMLTFSPGSTSDVAGRESTLKRREEENTFRSFETKFDGFARFLPQRILENYRPSCTLKLAEKLFIFLIFLLIKFLKFIFERDGEPAGEGQREGEGSEFTNGDIMT